MATTTEPQDQTQAQDQKPVSNPIHPEDQKEKKQLILNGFVITSPGHLAPGLWKHPRNRTAEYKKLSFWTDLAQRLDKANFHALFIADVLGGYDVYKGPANMAPAIPSGAQFPINDPLYSVPAMAAVTKNLVFGVTASTTYDLPYALARRFSTVDHLADGRVAWNIVTSYLESAARNLGLDTQIEHDERYRIADEYMDVVYKLWEGSWRDDAVVENVKTGQYAVPERVRQVHHKGKYFNVPGPHLCEPSPQRTPLLFQAGTSKSGRDFGAKHAEAIFLGGQLPEKVRPSVDAIRQIAKEKYGRNPRHVKIVAGMNIIVAETDEAARAKREELLSYGDKEGALALFGGWTGIDLSTYSDDEDFRFTGLPAIQSIVNGWASTVPGSDNLKWNKSRIVEYLLMGGMNAKIVGSPKTVADELERWVEVADVDGFNLSHVTNPGSFEDIIDFVIPELQKRGIFRTGVEKEGATAREAYLGSRWLLEDHPGSKFRWHADEEVPRYVGDGAAAAIRLGHAAQRSPSLAGWRSVDKQGTIASYRNRGLNAAAEIVHLARQIPSFSAVRAHPFLPDPVGCAVGYLTNSANTTAAAKEGEMAVTATEGGIQGLLRLLRAMQDKNGLASAYLDGTWRDSGLGG